MAWFILLLAGVFEVGWAVGLKYTQGFTRPLATTLTVIAMVASLWLLGLAVRELPLGTAYVIWTGIGAVGAMAAGVMLFGEALSAARAVSFALVLAGIAGLKLSSG